MSKLFFIYIVNVSFGMVEGNGVLIENYEILSSELIHFTLRFAQLGFDPRL